MKKLTKLGSILAVASLVLSLSGTASHAGAGWGKPGKAMAQRVTNVATSSPLPSQTQDSVSLWYPILIQLITAVAWL